MRMLFIFGLWLGTGIAVTALLGATLQSMRSAPRMEAYAPPAAPPDGWPEPATRPMIPPPALPKAPQ